jgi:hypothetical protein
VLEGALATLAGDNDRCPWRLSLLEDDRDESSLIRRSPSDIVVLVRGEDPYGIDMSDLGRDDPGIVISAELSWACWDVFGGSSTIWNKKVRLCLVGLKMLTSNTPRTGTGRKTVEQIRNHPIDTDQLPSFHLTALPTGALTLAEEMPGT